MSFRQRGISRLHQVWRTQIEIESQRQRGHEHRDYAHRQTPAAGGPGVDNIPPFLIKVPQQRLFQLTLGFLELRLVENALVPLGLQFRQPFPGNYDVLLVPIKWIGLPVAQQGRRDK